MNITDKDRLDWLDKHCFPDHFNTAQEQTYLASVWWENNKTMN